ncbi:MAG: MFS transporter, partial [Chloroflexota bacterium]|nr:MFS transporter [Chloroflexota bacterium]
MKRFLPISPSLERVYYGWWVLAAVFTLGLLSGGIFSFSNAIFFGPIKDDLLLTSAQTSLIFALARAEGSIAGPIVGRLVDKFGARSMIIGGGILASLGFMLLHWIDNYWVFVIIFVGIVSTGKSAGLGQTLLSAVNRWFIRRRALAMSICITGFSSGGAVLLPLITIGVHTIGWRDVMLYSGLFMLTIIIPLGRVVRHSPESMGLEPDGSTPTSNHESSNALQEPVRTAPQHEFLVREALRTKEYWILLAGSVMRITLWGATSVHGVEMMVWHGMDREGAGFMFSLMFLLSIPTRLIAGYLGDKLPLQPLLCTGMLAAAMACVSLLFFSGDVGILFFVM